MQISRYIGINVGLSINNIEFKNLYIEPASCNLEILYTSGCIGCNQLPYAVIGSSKVKHIGILQYTSNCSFTVKHLSCNNDLYILNPIKKYDYCSIYIPSINQTLNIHYKYQFVGKLNKLCYTKVY